MTVEVKKAVDEVGMPKLGVSVWVEGRQVARFELLDDADLFAVMKRQEIRARTLCKITINGDLHELPPGLYNVSYLKEIANIHPVDELSQEVVPGNNFATHDHDRTVTIKHGDVFFSQPPAAGNS